MTPLPANPWLPDQPFRLDERKPVDAIDPAPLFLRDPSPEFLRAVEFAPIVEVLRMFR